MRLAFRLRLPCVWLLARPGLLLLLPVLACQVGLFPLGALLLLVFYIRLLLLFIAIGLDRGVLTIVLAHTTFSMCYVSVVVSSRLVSFDRRCAATGAYLDGARAALLPPYVQPTGVQKQVTIARLRGMTKEGGLFDKSLPELISGSSLSAADAAKIENSCAGATAAISSFADWFEQTVVPRPDGEWRLGRKLYETKYAVQMDYPLDPDQLLARAEKSLEKTHAEMVAVSRRIHDGYLADEIKSGDIAKASELDDQSVVRNIFAKLSEDRSTSETLIEDSYALADAIVGFVNDKDLMDLPPTSKLRIEDIPPHLAGFAVAQIIPAPAFEPELESVWFWDLGLLSITLSPRFRPDAGPDGGPDASWAVDGPRGLEVVRGRIRHSVQEDGETRVVDRFVVSAPVNGYLQRIEREVGEAVKTGDVLAVLTGGGSATQQDLVLRFRLPRLLLASVLGGGLALAGATFQALLRNPLAEPYILGISGGSAVGAISGILLGLPRFPGVSATAFAGSMATLASGHRSAGAHRVVWTGTGDDGRALPSGSYLLCIRSGGGEVTQTVTLVR